ncbi:MAG: insulinase family protein, partial [Verrucomicrobiales bacterium]|nr:insulinase family protein [Verrucomicrobiales bacterium]
MKKPALSLAILVFCFAIFASTQDKAPQGKNDPIPLAHEGSDIQPDSGVTWDVLENGMRIAIMPNPEPPNRVSMRLYVDAGSLMEEENQQGLAHFLEHMAFNGTTNFPAGEMVEYFQRLGMGFGNHTNAHTSFNETVYKLELPNTEDKVLDEAFKLMRDYADGMKLLQEEIEAERGIILSEKRNRDSVGWRTFLEQIKFALPEHKVSKRLPIGTEEVIKNAGRDRFVEFYDKWYTPNRMALIVVGDIEVEKIQDLIEKYFADLEAREKAPDPELGEVSNRDFAAHYHYEEEAGETSVSIETLKTRKNPPDNA